MSLCSWLWRKACGSVFVFFFFLLIPQQYLLWISSTCFEMYWFTLIAAFGNTLAKIHASKCPLFLCPFASIFSLANSLTTHFYSVCISVVGTKILYTKVLLQISVRLLLWLSHGTSTGRFRRATHLLMTAQFIKPVIIVLPPRKCQQVFWEGSVLIFHVTGYGISPKAVDPLHWVPHMEETH